MSGPSSRSDRAVTPRLQAQSRRPVDVGSFRRFVFDGTWPAVHAGETVDGSTTRRSGTAAIGLLWTTTTSSGRRVDPVLVIERGVGAAPAEQPWRALVARVPARSGGYEYARKLEKPYTSLSCRHLYRLFRPPADPHRREVAANKYKKPAPTAARTSRTLTVWPEGAPSSRGPSTSTCVEIKFTARS